MFRCWFWIACAFVQSSSRGAGTCKSLLVIFTRISLFAELDRAPVKYKLSSSFTRPSTVDGSSSCELVEKRWRWQKRDSNVRGWVLENVVLIHVGQDGTMRMPMQCRISDYEATRN
eukprot:6212960-Pleurochrysis_carterae.AAC.2